MRAGELLRGARRPQLLGFAGATVEDARAAVALADRLGALVTTAPSEGPWPGAPAAPLRGISTATLGEIRDRSRVVVIWREDPETTHPRLLERLGLGSPVAERLLVVVDDRDTPTTARGGLRLSWPPDRDLDALVTLRDGDVGGLRERVDAVSHAAFVYGSGLTAGAGGQRRALALHELVRAMSHERHVVTLELPRTPGTRSADDVLAWQSGYDGRVDFASGHPELVIATEPLDDVDVTLSIESGPAGGLAVGPASEVWIRTARAGVSAAGTAHRLDGVPVTLQAPRPDGTPTAAAVLTRLLEEVGR
jgi:formylmethanofuran dehydrogenase subunit B